MFVYVLSGFLINVVKFQTKPISTNANNTTNWSRLKLKGMKPVPDIGKHETVRSAENIQLVANTTKFEQYLVP